MPLFAAYECTSKCKDGKDVERTDDVELNEDKCHSLTANLTASASAQRINLELVVSIYFMELDLRGQLDYDIFDNWFRTYCNGVKEIILSQPDTRDTMTLITSYV